MEFRMASAKDAKELVVLRKAQLKEEGATETTDIDAALFDFYVNGLSDESFVSWVAQDDGRIIATSGMSFAKKPPYYKNPTGKLGVLSNMYTLKEYRRKGIAKKLLDLVVKEAAARGCGAVHVTASDEGVLLYSSYGFRHNGNFMMFEIRD